ncbi:MAG: efflux RND transporter periplasmic adaptor subunit [Gemmatimonadaceae bacterium]
MIAATLALAVVACAKKEDAGPRVQTVTVERRDIVIDAQATGVVEPINVVEVKSKASGQIVQMTVETGTSVKPGELLVQVDTREVKSQYNQALADVRAAQARVEVVQAQRKRSDTLFAARIITAQENETTRLDFANAQAQLVRTRASLDQAQQRMEDATVRAPVAGTVIEKTVSLGQVITSATGAFGGGTTLLKMADLGQVRVRALVNESDIGSIQPGQQGTVTVDAYPDRPFRGIVEKIEPQAVVQQSVTMFPVLISLANREGFLKPGMNGEVSILIDRRDNVLTVPNDAVRNPREAALVAPALGMSADEVSRQIQAQFASAGGRGGRGAGTDGNGGARAQGTGRGDVDLAAGQTGGQRGQRAGGQAGAGADGLGDGAQAGQGRQGGQGAMGGAGGGFQQLPEVTTAQCDKVDSAFARKPAARARLDSLRDRMRAGELDREAYMAQTRTVYESVGADQRVTMACRMRAGGAQAGGAQAGGGQAGGGQGGGRGGAGGRRSTRSGVVFVADSGSTYKLRMVRLGASNYDYSEVLSGVTQGERVALLAAAQMSQQRQDEVDRMRQRTGGGVPGIGQPAGGRGGPGGGRGPGSGGQP